MRLERKVKQRMNETEFELRAKIERLEKMVDGKAKSKPICVKSISLAYRIIEAGHLHLLIGVRRDRKNDSLKIWFFAPTDEIRKIVDDFYTDRNKRDEFQAYQKNLADVLYGNKDLQHEKKSPNEDMLPEKLPSDYRLSPRSSLFDYSD